MTTDAPDEKQPASPAAELAALVNKQNAGKPLGKRDMTRYLVLTNDDKIVRQARKLLGIKP